MSRHLALLTALAVASACTIGAEPVSIGAPAGAAAEGGGLYSTGTRLTVRVTTVREAGRVAVCAAWAVDGDTAQTKIEHRRVLDTGVVSLGGRNVLQGFERFPRAASRADLASTEPGCVLTRRAWREADSGLAPRVHFGHLILERDEEDGITLWFRGV